MATNTGLARMMTITDLPIALTRKLVDFSIVTLSGIEEDAAFMYAPAGPVYWSREETQGLANLLGSDKDEPEYGAIFNLTPRQKDILYTLFDVYAQEDVGWSDEQAAMIFNVLSPSI